MGMDAGSPLLYVRVRSAHWSRPHPPHRPGNHAERSTAHRQAGRCLLVPHCATTRDDAQAPELLSTALGQVPRWSTGGWIVFTSIGLSSAPPALGTVNANSVASKTVSITRSTEHSGLCSSNTCCCAGTILRITTHLRPVSLAPRRPARHQGTAGSFLQLQGRTHTLPAVAITPSAVRWLPGHSGTAEL